MCIISFLFNFTLASCVLLIFVKNKGKSTKKICVMLNEKRGFLSKEKENQIK